MDRTSLVDRGRRRHLGRTSLIKAGADVNIKDRNGETALTRQKANKLEIVEALKKLRKE